MAQQALTLLYAWIFLPVVQVLQLINVVLALRLAFLHVDVSQNTLNNADLRMCKHTPSFQSTFPNLQNSLQTKSVCACVLVKTLRILTAFSRLAVSGCSGGVCRRISFSRSGYFTSRDRGMSRKLHRSSFLLKGDSRQRCRKSCTFGSCFFWSSKALAASWLLQYAR